MPDLSSKSALARLVGTPFAMQGVSPEVTLVLEGVEDLPHATERDDCFTLTFLGPGHVQIPQGVWRLRDEAGEDAELFLVPIALDADGLRLESVFNRLSLEELRELAPQR